MYNYHLESGDYPASWYRDSAGPLPPERPAVEGHVRCDVCIVGGGYTGLSAALDLAGRGYDVLLVEANRIGWGASGRNGGQVVRAYNRDQDRIAHWMGREDAERLWQIGEDSLALLRQRITDHGIDCDLTWGYLHAAEKPSQLADCRATIEEWQPRGVEGLALLDRDAIAARLRSPRYIGGLYDPGSGHLHPLKLALGLARAVEAAGVTLAEHSRVERLDGHEGAGPVTLHLTGGASVTARYVLLAGNAHLRGVAPGIESYVMPVGTHIVATEVLGEERAQQLIPGNEAACDLYFVLNYYRRSPDHRLLFGGRVSYSGYELAGVTDHTAAKMAKIFPQLAGVRIDYSWGGFVGIAMNRMPQLGRLGPNTFYAHGFSGHGVALTGMAGRMVAEAIAGTAERFDVMARIPHHRFPGGRLLRMPALVLAMTWYRLRDLL